LERGVDPSQPVGPQLVPIGQQHFEQTPLALFALNHARSFDESTRAGSVDTMQSVVHGPWRLRSPARFFEKERNHEHHDPWERVYSTGRWLVVGVRVGSTILEAGIYRRDGSAAAHPADSGRRRDGVDDRDRASEETTRPAV